MPTSSKLRQVGYGANFISQLKQQACFESPEQYIEFLQAGMPDWATGVNHTGALKKGTQLCTRDGRRMGNACIQEHYETPIRNYYICKTDVGNVVHLSEREVNELFFIGLYFMKVDGIPFCEHPPLN